MAPDKTWKPTIQSLLNPVSPERDRGWTPINQGVKRSFPFRPQQCYQDTNNSFNSASNTTPRPAKTRKLILTTPPVDEGIIGEQVEVCDYKDDEDMESEAKMDIQDDEGASIAGESGVDKEIVVHDNHSSHTMEHEHDYDTYVVDEDTEDYQLLHNSSIVNDYIETKASSDKVENKGANIGNNQQRMENRNEIETEEGSEDDRQRFELDKILEFKVDRTNATVQFLIEWANMPVSQATWENERDIQEDCPRVVYDYWRKRRGRDAATGLDTYHVFQILEQSFNRKQNTLEFKVQWVGYPRKDSSSVDESFLEENSAGLLEMWRAWREQEL